MNERLLDGANSVEANSSEFNGAEALSPVPGGFSPSPLRN